MSFANSEVLKKEITIKSN